MISASDRENAIQLIDAAVASGSRLSPACQELGITERTYYRWKWQQKNRGDISDQRPVAKHPEPANKLSSKEREKILEVVSQPEYKDLPPCEIVPALADKGEYIASESTFYRVLRENHMAGHRGRSSAPVKRQVSTHVATAPNQVWMWDITYLNGPARGLFYYLYMISDLFSSDVVGWEVWPEESAEHAAELIERTSVGQHRLSTSPLILHSDNGSPMKGATMLEKLYQLGIIPSNSRPRVSNDNARAESLFRTLKYRPNYQPKGFATLEEAREWCQRFVNWYRHEHHHSALNFLTPAQRHEQPDHGHGILAKRHEVYEAAKKQHPERWNGRDTRDWSIDDVVYLSPDQQIEPAEQIENNSETQAS